MENQNNNQIPGWRDININDNLPINALINLLSIINQRLATVEDNTFIKQQDNRMLSLTEIYAIQTMQEQAAAAEAERTAQEAQAVEQPAKEEE